MKNHSSRFRLRRLAPGLRPGVQLHSRRSVFHVRHRPVRRLPGHAVRLLLAPGLGRRRLGQAHRGAAKGIDNRLRLSFTEQGLSITGGCNTQFGGYRYDKGVLQVAQLAATMKACEPGLMALDAEVGQRIKGDLRASVATDAPEPVLQLLAQDGAVLKFTGEPTPETRYGSKGETMFLEVAAKRVKCSHPMIPNYQCLQVRERRYSESGVQQPATDKWHPLYQSIDGYEHRDGVRTVLRVKQYDWKNPPADAPSKVYVLDMVVEQDMSGKKPK